MAQPKPQDIPVTRAWRKPPSLSPKGWLLLAAVLLAVNYPVIHGVLLRRAPQVSVQLPYQDDFSSPERLSTNYWSGGGFWRLLDGELFSPGVRNNPLWLKAKLPPDVKIEFDVRSLSPEGDIKVELFGNGTDHASGYVLIHGGWNNSISVIARLDEHGTSRPGVIEKDTHMRVEARLFPVQIGKRYHWKIERRGSLLSWSIDGQPFLSFDDPFPLKGDGHDRFGFSSWESDLYFDNLSLQPL